MIRPARLATLAAILIAPTACQPPENPPAKTLALGVAIDGEPTPERLAAFTDSTGIPPRLVVSFVSWPPEPEASFASPAPGIEAVATAGAIPVLTWEPWTFPPGSDGKPVGIAAAEIFDGEWDPYIDAWLTALRDTGQEVWVRFAHEMNTSHYRWGIPDLADFGPDAPFVYRRLFRHVVDRARALGATNVRWVFCPNAESVPPPATGATWNQATRYYPGDDYVNVLGMDGYNWGDTVNTPTWTTRWQSFEEIFAPLHRELSALTPTKPIIVFETASAPSGGDKSAWIQAALDSALAWHLAGLVWFDVNKETDWRLAPGTSPQALAALRAANSATPTPAKTATPPAY